MHWKQSSPGWMPAQRRDRKAQLLARSQGSLGQRVPVLSAGRAALAMAPPRVHRRHLRRPRIRRPRPVEGPVTSVRVSRRPMTERVSALARVELPEPEHSAAVAGRRWAVQYSESRLMNGLPSLLPFHPLRQLAKPVSGRRIHCLASRSRNLYWTPRETLPSCRSRK